MDTRARIVQLAITEIAVFCNIDLLCMVLVVVETLVHDFLERNCANLKGYGIFTDNCQ